MGITINPKSGKGNATITITATENETPDVIERTVIVKGCDDVYARKVRIIQDAGNIIRIPEFDFLTLSYCWNSESGKDYDSATAFTNTGLSYGGKTIDNRFVGWSKLDFGSGGMATTSPHVGPEPYFIQWGGDNQHSGKETVKIDMKTLLANHASLPDIVNIDVYGNWFESVGNGRVCVTLSAYKGGSMTLDASSYQFKNVGGELVYSDKKGFIIEAFGKTSYQNIKSMYTKLCHINYDKNTREGTIFMDAKPNSLICQTEACR